MNKIYKICFIALIIINIGLIGLTTYLYNQNDKLDIKDLSENDYILYKGFLLDPNEQMQNPSGMLKSSYIEEDFNGLYYNYSGGRFAGKTVGFTEEYYEDGFWVNNTGKYSFTKPYNVIPRNVTIYDWGNDEIINKYPEIKDYSDRYSVSGDLNNDGKKEYVVCVNDNESAYSSVSLYDFEGNKIDTLIYIKEGYWAGIKDENYKFFITEKDIELLDIDNDGIMEILVESPAYEGNMVTIFKYDGEKIIGETNIDAGIYLRS